MDGRTGTTVPGQRTGPSARARAQMAAADVAAGDEQATVGACEIFAELIEAPAPVLGPALPELIRWAMSVGGTRSLDLDTREAAVRARSRPGPSAPVCCSRASAMSMGGLRSPALGARALDPAPSRALLQAGHA
jgi:hypothetical protein